MTSQEQEDNVVIVTGAGRGIGRGIASALVEAGASVLIAELDEALGRETARALAEEYPDTQVDFARTDVADEASVAAAVAHARERFGRIDGLVNNAGIADPITGPIESLDFARWNKVIATNLSGALLCTKHCVPELRRRHGAIVNIASTRAIQSEPQSEAYAAAKGGIVALTHALALSLGPAVRVNCISPGWIDVGKSELRPIDHQQHPVGRVGLPEDIASLTLFLLGEQAGFITGQNFVVDGGMTKKMIYED
jgi:NAD(P)-dependent dehydrogenase (short-subunit alcohol dehydrogenase family)